MSNFAMPVDMYMSKPVHQVNHEAPLPKVQELLHAHRISSLAVVDDGRALVGVVSRTDLLRVGRLGAGRRPLAAVLSLPNTPVADVMTKGALTVAPGDSIRDAARSMLDKRVHRVFVLDDDALVGVLSTKDIMLAVSNEKVRLPIEKYMSAPVFTVRASEPVALAVERLERARVSGVIVLDEDWPVGVFTQTESMLAAAMPRNTPIEEVMSPAMLCMNVKTLMHRAAAQAAATRARRVIATQDRGMCGILTGLDFAKATQDG